MQRCHELAMASPMNMITHGSQNVVIGWHQRLVGVKTSVQRAMACGKGRHEIMRRRKDETNSLSGLILSNQSREINIETRNHET